MEVLVGLAMDIWGCMPSSFIYSCMHVEKTERLKPGLDILLLSRPSD